MLAELPKPQLETCDFAGIPLLTDNALYRATGVRIAFTGRDGGTSEGPYASLNLGGHVEDDPVCVKRNRTLLMNALGCPDARLIVPNQIHETHVVRVLDPDGVDSAAEEAHAGGDALAIGIVGVAAQLNFADCLPLIIVAPSGRFAVVHAGWRGAVKGIAGEGVRALAEIDGGSDPSTFNAYIGPHIRSECFETGADVTSLFVKRFGADVAPEDRHVDLSFAVRADLMDAGLSEGRIADAQICTVCNSDRFFSYRVSGTCGRQAAFACRIEDAAQEYPSEGEKAE